jgi:D-arabinose 1-dehydrogenase-like Zn-dependent alcohol dehydrogenase
VNPVSVSPVPAFALLKSGGRLAPVRYQPRALRDDDVRIDIAYAGICHSDIHVVREEWHPALLPLVPGHEITGVVREVGAGVTRHRPGDRVGVGCMVDSCGECEFCRAGREQFCSREPVMTYNVRGYDGEPTRGGYARQITVTERFVVSIPDALALDVAAPLLCAGITTWEPLVRWGVGPGSRVAVVGLGGLGHVAVKLARALGAEVTVISRSTAKKADAEDLGAAHYLATADAGAFGGARSAFDLLINTVSSGIDLSELLRSVRPLGVVVNLGLPVDLYSVHPYALVQGSKVLAGSNIGGIAATQQMLDFCGARGVGAQIETIDATAVNDAYDRVVAGAARYRVVIDVATIPDDGPLI